MKVNGLIKYPPFWGVLVVGLLISGASVIALYIEEVSANDLVLCGTKKCFFNFIEIYHFPLEILKATIALLAIIALIHKSAETQKQIIISESQNNFSNHHKHMEEFFKYINSFNIGMVKFQNRKLHAVLYPRSRVGELRVSAETIDKLDVDIGKMIEFIKALSVIDKDNLYDRYVDAILNYEVLNNLLHYLHIDLEDKVILSRELTEKSAFLFCLKSLHSTLLLLHILNYVTDFDGIACFSLKTNSIFKSINMKDITSRINSIIYGNSNDYGEPTFIFNFKTDKDSSVNSLNELSAIINEIV